MNWSAWNKLDIYLEEQWFPFDVALNSNGKIEVFYISTASAGYALYSFEEISPNSKSWSKSYLLADRIKYQSKLRRLINNRNELVVFVISDSDFLMEKRRPFGGSWSTWKYVVNASIISFDVGNNKGGDMQVFMIIQYNTGKRQRPMFEYKREHIDPEYGNWWHNVDLNDNTFIVMQDVIVAQRQDGSLEAFLQGRERGAFTDHAWQIVPDSNEWSGWQVAASNAVLRSVIKNKNDILVLFVTDNLKIKYRKMNLPDENATWIHLTGPLSSNIFPILRQDGRLEVYVTDDSKILYSSETSQNSDIWTEWNNLSAAGLPDGVFVRPLIKGITIDLYHKLHLFITDKGQLYHSYEL